MMQRLILDNGTFALIRPVQPDDLYLIHDLHRHLSATSIYFRYLRPYKPTLADANRICRADDHGAGMIAISADQTVALGLVHYSVDQSSPEATAELGIVVADRVQGQGLGRALLDQISRQASSRGINAFQLYIHPENKAMIRLLGHTGYPIKERFAHGVRETRMMLPPYGQFVPHGVRRDAIWAMAEP